MRYTVFGLLFAGFLLLFYSLWEEACVLRWLQKARKKINHASRSRLLQERERLLKISEQSSFFDRLEKELHYSGLKRRFPKLNAEWYLTIRILAVSIVTVLSMATVKPVVVLVSWIILAALKKGILSVLRMWEQKKVNDNLLKLLDFLGNYSITAGELSSVFLQVGKFVDEPLKSALEQCCYEAQTTGDISAAMLSMADKIEHPKFKELVKNLEIAGRYCADLTIMVNSSRHSMRDYLRMQRERKGMLGEAGINMGLLLLLAVLSLAIVDRLISTSVWYILFATWPGRIALAVILLIFGLFGKQVLEINK